MVTVNKSLRPLYRARIGNREVVGPCVSVEEHYYDLVDLPCPPIRFKEPTPEINALREKEKGSWKALTIDEKKKLYRYSFCQTFSEMQAPTAHWRWILGNTMLLTSIPIVIFAIIKANFFPPLPESMSDQGKKQLVRWYIDSRADSLDGGITSKWDYEKNQWKERPYLLMKSK